MNNNTDSIGSSEATTIANYQLRQKMLCFAYLAYSGEGITTPNPDATIAGLINTGLGKIKSVDVSDWTVVWGPVTYTLTGSLFQDNLMYVLQQNNTSNYVIAIRGTNGINELDWLLEDFEVQNTMPWPLSGTQSSAQAGCAVTESTSIAMNFLLTMADPTSGFTVAQYLKSVSGSQIDVCVTGHSLGGALAPTLALWLLESPLEWDGSPNGSTVSCISFAGPTAGNQQFASYSMSMFASAMSYGSFPGWDTRLLSNCDTVACNMDVAPFVYSYANIFDFNTATAGALFNVYSASNQINFSGLTGFEGDEWSYFQEYVIMPLAAALYSQNYTQLQAPAGSDQAPLTGTFFSNYAPAGQTFLDYLTAFYAQAGWQHVYSYPQVLNVSELQYGSSIINEDLPPLTLTLMSPSYLENDTSNPVKPSTQAVTFTGTGFSAGATVDIYPAGVTVKNVIVNSEGTQLTANLTFPGTFFYDNKNAWTWFSYYIFRIMNSDGSFSNTTTFYYSHPNV